MTHVGTCSRCGGEIISPDHRMDEPRPLSRCIRCGAVVRSSKPVYFTEASDEVPEWLAIVRKEMSK